MTTTYLFANDAMSSLAAPISSMATSLTLYPGGGALFPNPSSGQGFTISVVDVATGRFNEIMLCTAISGDTLTVIRAQEGTAARAWLAGDFVNQFLTAGTATNFFQLSSPSVIESSSLVPTGVTAGIYGSSAEIPVLTINAQGQITEATTAGISNPSYQGTWNANTNTPHLTSSVGTQGYYYIVSVAGTTTLDGISSWAVGDQAIFDGSVWQKIPGVADGVFSTLEVASLTGYMYGNGSSVVTASATIPTSALTGTVAVDKGGTGVDTLTGLAYGNGTSPFTAATSDQLLTLIGSTPVQAANSISNSGGWDVTPNDMDLDFVYDDTTVATLDNLGNFTPNGVCTGGFGFGQTWTNVTSSRAIWVSYYNNTTKPIYIAVNVTMIPPASISSTINMYLYVGTLLTATQSLAQSSNNVTQTITLNAFIPPGGTSYYVIGVGTTGADYVLNYWLELR